MLMSKNPLAHTQTSKKLGGGKPPSIFKVLEKVSLDLGQQKDLCRINFKRQFQWGEIENRGS